MNNGKFYVEVENIVSDIDWNIIYLLSVIDEEGCAIVFKFNSYEKLILFIENIVFNSNSILEIISKYDEIYFDDDYQEGYSLELTN